MKRSGKGVRKRKGVEEKGKQTNGKKKKIVQKEGKMRQEFDKLWKGEKDER